jgi:hypothetical protein
MLGLLLYDYTTRNHYFIPLRPNPLSVLGGGLTVLPPLDTVLPLLSAPPFPSFASLSKKSCHSSANDSLLLELLAISIGSAAAALNEGVDGVRLNGDNGMRRPVELDAAPGRARPACSFCSKTYR